MAGVYVAAADPPYNEYTSLAENREVARWRDGKPSGICNICGNLVKAGDEASNSMTGRMAWSYLSGNGKGTNMNAPSLLGLLCLICRES